MADMAPIVLSGLPDAPSAESLGEHGDDESSLDLAPAEVVTTDDVMDWKRITDTFYMRRWRMFDMVWKEPDLGSHIVRAAPCGGPIVVAPQRGAFSVMGGTGTRHDAVRVYNGAGMRLAVIDPPSSGGRLVTAGITNGCRVVVVRSDGAVDLFSPLGERLRVSFSLPGSTCASVGGPAGGAPGSGPADLGALLGGGRSRAGSVVMAEVGRRGLAALLLCEEEVPSDDPDAPDGATVTVSALKLVICGDLDSDAPGQRCTHPMPCMLDGRPPASMALLDFEGDAPVDVILATSDLSSPALVVVSEDGCDPVRAVSGFSGLPAVADRMAVSPDGRSVALLCGSQLRVYRSALTEPLLVVEVADLLADLAGAAGGAGLSSPGGDVGRTPPPTTLAWLGDEDGIALHWDGWGILIVGQDGSCCGWRYAKPSAVLSEGDGLRVLTADHHDFLAMVVEDSRWARLDMSQPGARLVNAAELFDTRDASAMEAVQSLQRAGELSAAVDQCLAAAEEEHSRVVQQRLLAAAYFGTRASDAGSSPASLSAVCRRIRVLNALRRPAVGCAMTAFQLEVLTPAAAADRLSQQLQHDAALRVCQCMGLPTRRVLEHWAAAKVAKCRPDEEAATLQVVSQRLQAEPGVSFADVAAAAHASGRAHIARSLLRLEPRLRRKVPLLLQMREGAAALDAALRGADLGLVSLTVAQLRERLAVNNDVGFEGAGRAGTALDDADDGGDEGAVTAGGMAEDGAAAGASGRAADSEGSSAAEGAGKERLFALLSGRPQALAMAEEQLSEDDPVMLQQLLEGAGRFRRAAQESLRLAGRETRFSRRLRELGNAVAILTRGIDGGDRSLTGLRTAVQNQMELLSAQVKLEQSFDAPMRFVGRSLADTLLELLRLEGDGSDRAKALAARLKVPDSRFWYLRIEALAAARAFDELAALAAKRSPVGYAPFVRAFLDARPRAMAQAKRVCPKVEDPPERLRLQCECEAWDDAAETARRIGTAAAAIEALQAMGMRGSGTEARAKLEALAASGR
ncbi:hypothetical protein FNF29_08154 [Cafeteria roenbergensis]|uniref:Vacuolar protein sorting-associated protein 16 homolog n=1 Tax=Cafeteria roenbergensis TaxID=33653 RepID=A0A5A8BZW7_CAFRO|nr:hypothetical protein FNF29_08154 [Cafeteria roenbergensis]|eukprot:KAA0146283.1 hypothetical protein FNF29_08154 [Cafeteria roenbergensis]